MFIECSRLCRVGNGQLRFHILAIHLCDSWDVRNFGIWTVGNLAFPPLAIQFSTPLIAFPLHSMRAGIPLFVFKSKFPQPPRNYYHRSPVFVITLNIHLSPVLATFLHRFPFAVSRINFDKNCVVVRSATPCYRWRSYSSSFHSLWKIWNRGLPVTRGAVFSLHISRDRVTVSKSEGKYRGDERERESLKRNNVATSFPGEPRISFARGFFFFFFSSYFFQWLISFARKSDKLKARWESIERKVGTKDGRASFEPFIFLYIIFLALFVFDSFETRIVWLVEDTFINN